MFSLMWKDGLIDWLMCNLASVSILWAEIVNFNKNGRRGKSQVQQLDKDWKEARLHISHMNQSFNLLKITFSIR